MRKVKSNWILTVVLFGCSDLENCNTDLSQDFMIVTFHEIATQNLREVGFTYSETSSGTQFQVVDDEGEPVSFNALTLELNAADTATEYTFTSDTSSFQLRVRHEISVEFFDEECEPSVFFTGLDTLSYTFDSVAVVGTVTNSLIPVNVEVYF
ncbi:MAG: hypothetical protein AAF789_05275 [Bacteroidota bacterium]